jgi:hypothetical protein
VNRRDLATELDYLVKRIRRNGPNHRDPEAFHVERDAIANDAMGIVHKLRGREPLE